MNEVIEDKSHFVERPMNELFAALAKAQGEYSPVKMDKKVAFNKVRYEYASFAAIFQMANKINAKHELSVMQTTTVDNVLITKLCHSSGQYETSAVQLPTANNVKDHGGNMSLHKRYQYLAICGIVATDDDDETSVDSNTKPQKQEKQEKQANHIDDIFDEVQARTGNYYQNKPHLSNALKKSGLTGWPPAKDAEGIEKAILSGIKYASQEADEAADEEY